MPYVITEPCIGTKDRSCVDVCPVDCFYNFKDASLNKDVGKEPGKPEDYGMLVIHPDECIHCGACEPECPVDAIFEDSDVPEKYSKYIEINERAVANLSPAELDAIKVTSK